MQVSIENISQLGRKLSVEIPSDNVLLKVDERLKKISKTTKMQGFRVGKVPLHIIRAHYDKQVRHEVATEIIESSFYDAISQNNLKPMAPPQIDNIQNEEGQNLLYTAIFEIYPEVSLHPVEQLKMDKFVCEINDEEVNVMIENLRKQRGTLKEVQRSTQIGDVLTVDIESFGAANDDKYSDKKIELGKNAIMAGVDDQLVDHVAGDTVTVNTQFPKDYPHEELRNKPIKYEISIHAVAEIELPDLDEKFCQALGIKGNVDSLSQTVKDKMMIEAEVALQRKNKDAVFNLLYQNNHIELPEMICQAEEQRIIEGMQNNLKQQNLNADIMDHIDDQAVKETAKKNISLQLIIAEIVKQHELKPNAQEVRKIIEQIASGYEDPNTIIQWYYNDQKNLSKIEAMALEEEVVQWAMQNMQLTDVPLSFQEVAS